MSTIASKRRQHWADASPVHRQRLARGWSRDKLARRAGISRAAVDRAERGDPVSDRSWWKLAEALQVPREWLDEDFRANLTMRGVLCPIHQRDA